MRRLWAQRCDAGVNAPPVTYSIGVATFHTMPDSLDQLIEKADALMYTVKQGGKNAIRQEVY